MWTHEKQIDFCTVVSLLGLTELLTSKALLEQLWRHSHMISPEVGRRDAYLIQSVFLPLMLFYMHYKSFCVCDKIFSLINWKTKPIEKENTSYIKKKTKLCRKSIVAQKRKNIMDCNSVFFFLILWFFIFRFLHFFSFLFNLILWCCIYLGLDLVDCFGYFG